MRGRTSWVRIAAVRTAPLLVLALGLALAACHSSSGADGGSGDGNGPGSECTANSECQSGICVLPDANTPIGFCTETCHHQSDCGDFPGGCCVPTSDGSVVCAISALCTDGDAGLGDPCPTGDECALGLICLSDSSGAITECSQPCQDTTDCGGVSQECCDDLSGGQGAPILVCVLDPACTTAPDAGPAYDAGPIGPGGDDGGPFYAALYVDGTLTADTNAFLGFVGQDFALLSAPPLGQNLQLDLQDTLAPGTYACDGGLALSDAGLEAILSTRTDQSPTFAALLPGELQNLTFPFACGPLGGASGDVVQDANVSVDAFTPGRVRSADAGPVSGHLQGSAYLRVGPDDGGTGSTLELRARFDVPLTPP